MKPLVFDRDTGSFLEKARNAGGPPIYTLSPAEARKVLETVQSGDGVTARNVTWEAESVQVEGRFPAVIYRPQGKQGTVLPAAIYLHGGGWILGGRTTHDRLCGMLAQLSGCAVIFVEYSLSPEAPFPQALEEGYAVFQWFAANGKRHAVDGERLAVAGDSAGGNLATVLALLALERKGMLPKAQLLFYPVTSARMDTASYAEFAEGPWLTRPAMEWFWKAYVSNPAQRDLPEVSPLNAPPEALAAMPATLVITAEADVLRDEGEAYAAKLRQSGVDVRGMRYLGAIHDFAMLNPLAASPAARDALLGASRFLRDVLRPTG